MTTKRERVPLRIGEFTLRWCALMLLPLAGALFGAYAYLQQAQRGLIVTGLRSIGSGGAGWGLYIVGDVFFIGVSFAGITTASLIRLFGIAPLRPLARIAELLTIVALVLGAFTILADLGRPLAGLVNLPMYARPSSPFFGSFTMVMGGYLFASLVYFYLAGRADAAYCARHARRFRFAYRLWASGYRNLPRERRRHHQSSFWMSLFILPLLVTAHSTLGFIFGLQGGRPGWFGALQAPAFVVVAGVSGIGVLIVTAAAVRWALNLQEAIKLEAFRWLGNLLWVLIVVTLYFVIADELTASYAASTHERRLAHEIAFGAYRRLFALEVACLLVPLAILFTQFVTKRTSVGWSVAAGLIVNVAAVLKRFLLVVPSQTYGVLLDYPRGAYHPTWVEVGFLGGLVCLGIFLYALFIKLFPIVPLEDHPAGPFPKDPEPRGRRRLRLGLTLACLLGGLTLSVLGFAVSARAGTEPYLDPILPLAPVIFILGVMMAFYSAAVYETLPPEKAPPEGPG